MMNPHTHSTTENILDLLAAINLDLAGQPASRTNAPLPETQYHPVFWQAVENTVLDIRSVNPNLSEDELIKMLTTWGWMSWTKVPQQNSPDIRYLGVYFHTLKPRSTTTIAHTAILISWPVQERGGLVEHLHQLGKALKSQFRPWSAIAGAVLGTEHFFQSNPDSDDFVPMGAVFAGFTQDLVHETGKAISEKRAQQIAWDCLQRVPKDGHDLLTRYKLDAVSTALVLLELGQLLWTPRVLQHMAHRRFQYAKAVAVWHFLGDLADNWLYLVEQDCRKIEVCGKPLRVGPS